MKNFRNAPTLIHKTKPISLHQPAKNPTELSPHYPKLQSKTRIRVSNNINPIFTTYIIFGALTRSVIAGGDHCLSEGCFAKSSKKDQHELMQLDE